MKTILLILLFVQIGFAQSKIMISGTDAVHDSIVCESLKIAHPNAVVSRSLNALNQTFIDSIEALGYNMLVRSTTGYEAYKVLSDTNNVLFVMPSGSNNHESTGITLGSIVSTGCGTDSNITGYPIHFYSIDPTGSNLSSYSNGYIAGLIAKFSDTFCTTPQRAYYWFTYGDTLEHNGYGKINYDNASLYYGKFHRKIYIK